jgi:16S rRNA (uracil1498-N3)-methyltransferase
MAERFYTSDVLGPGECRLEGAEAHHLSAVRRFAAGDRITLFNGDGNEYAAEIASVGKKSVVVNVLSSAGVDRELPFPLVIAAAVPKGDRADYLIEKLTELGVTRFVPLVAARSVVIPREPSTAKFSRAVIEASKQCGRNRLMAIDSPLKWTALLARDDLPAQRVLFHPSARESNCSPLSEGGVIAAIGPEGGFVEEELTEAVRTGWKVVSLGPRVLRVETAATAAASLIALSNPACRASRALP